MADTELYVERGYAPAGYINNILQGVATLSVSASTSTNGGFLREGSATIYAGDRTAKTITAYGDVEISTAQARFGAGSALITDTGDYFTISGDSDLYNGDFTVEMWVYASNLTSIPNGTIWDNRTSSSSGFLLYVSYGSIGLYEGINLKGLTSAGFNNSQWNHIAVVRNGTNAKVFVNGVQKISATVTTTNYSNRISYIGSTYQGLTPLRSYFDEVRLSSSVRYTTGFTPSTSAFTNDSDTGALLHLDTAFIDDNGSLPGLVAFASTLTAAAALRDSSVNVDVVSTLTADAVQTKRSTTSLGVSATLSSAGAQTKNGTISISSALTANIFAVATVSPGGNFVVTATVSSSATRSAGLSATLITAGDEVEWDDALTWQEPRSEYWGPLFVVSAIKVTGLVTESKNLISTATLSCDAVRTARVDITVDSFATMSVQGLQISEGTTTMSSTATMDVAGVATNGILNEVLDSNFSLISAAQVIISGEATLNSQFTTSNIGNYTTGSVSKTLSVQATETLSGNAFRLRRFSTSISSAFTVQVDGDRIADGTVLQASAGTMSVKANPLWGPYQQSLDAQATIFINGGVLRDGSATLSALNAILATLTIYSIDPYRIYTIPTESRIATIEADTRIFTVISENRLNTLEKETRTIEVDSESRYLEVQRLRLVDQFGVKDRREG